jgi:hypothetical protein
VRTLSVPPANDVFGPQLHSRPRIPSQSQACSMWWALSKPLSNLPLAMQQLQLRPTFLVADISGYLIERIRFWWARNLAGIRRSGRPPGLNVTEPRSHSLGNKWLYGPSPRSRVRPTAGVRHGLSAGQALARWPSPVGKAVNSGRDCCLHRVDRLSCVKWASGAWASPLKCVRTLSGKPGH